MEDIDEDAVDSFEEDEDVLEDEDPFAAGDNSSGGSFGD